MNNPSPPQTRDPESRLVTQEQSEAQRVDMEGSDRRGQMASQPAAGAAAASARGLSTASAGVLHLREGLLRGPAAG